MVHMAHCRKNITTLDIVKLLGNAVFRFHGICRVVYSYTGAECNKNSSHEFWQLIGTILGIVNLNTHKFMGG